jgi:cyclase
MLKVRIIPCLDVKDGKVVKGVQFRGQQVVGDILELASRYSDEGADELVLYDIAASSAQRTVDRVWIERVASVVNIPFCVAGGIRSISDAEAILAAGADKISINSPALENPSFITDLSLRFGSQCVVVGIDSFKAQDGYYVYQYTGDSVKTKNTKKLTEDWVKEVEERGAGEVVINCMNQDGMRQGYDISQFQAIENKINIPIVASGGAGAVKDFTELFLKTTVTGALAASVFHTQALSLSELKRELRRQNIEVRL